MFRTVFRAGASDHVRALTSWQIDLEGLELGRRGILRHAGIDPFQRIRGRDLRSQGRMGAVEALQRCAKRTGKAWGLASVM